MYQPFAERCTSAQYSATIADGLMGLYAAIPVACMVLPVSEFEHITTWLNDNLIAISLRNCSCPITGTRKTVDDALSIS